MTKRNPSYPFLRAAIPEDIRPPRGTGDSMHEVTGIARVALDQRRRVRFRTRLGL
jgi:hypothetical protein